MNAPLEPKDEAIANAEGKLERLGVQVQAMRAVLVRLLQDVVLAEGRLAQVDAARLREANEQLVVAALTSQAEADTATMALDEAQSSAAIDVLTQLPNRLMLSAHFERAIAHAKRQGSRLALLFLDLDHFKRLNDTHGHGLGDQLLRLLAVRMRLAVREVDIVSRHGGDEFVVLLDDLADPQAAQAVANKLIAAIGLPAEIDGHVVSVSASIGIAIYPEHGEDVDTLIRRADAAMYQSKRRGSGGSAFHGVAGVQALTPRAQPGHGAGVDADLERRQVLLREANEKLVLSALSAHELKAAAEAAQQRQAAFMASVADELRDPMAPIRIAAAMLGRQPGDEPLLPRVQGIVQEQLTQMSRLLGNLVDAANVDSGGLELDRRPVDLAQVIDESVAALRPAMERRGQHFELQRPPGELTVNGDAPRLAQVVCNLLDNACKHSHDGGRISLSVAVTADTLTMTVSDDGIGITPPMLLHVFDPFVQDIHAIGLNGTGLGIGLTIVRALVRAHGGNLVARSAGLGQGSQFIVTLPRSAGGRSALATDAQAVGSDRN